MLQSLLDQMSKQRDISKSSPHTKYHIPPGRCEVWRRGLRSLSKRASGHAISNAYPTRMPTLSFHKAVKIGMPPSRPTLICCEEHGPASYKLEPLTSPWRTTLLSWSPLLGSSLHSSAFSSRYGLCQRATHAAIRSHYSLSSFCLLEAP